MSTLRRASPFRHVVAWCIAGLVCAAGPATANPVTYDFTAEVSLLNNLASPTDPVVGLSLGDTVTGSFTYEANRALDPALSITRQELIDAGLTPLPAGDPSNDGFHAEMADGISESFQVAGGPSFAGDPVFSINFSIAGNTYSFGGDSLIRHRTNEWVPTPDRPAYAYDSLIAFADLFGDQSGIRLMDDAVYSGLFPSDSTLSALPSLSELFLARVFTSIDLDGDGATDTQVFARVTALSARSVPEPGPLALIVSGLVLLRWRMRKT